MPNDHTTIVAVSSPPGRSWRGLVRLSGPATHSILRSLQVVGGGGDVLTMPPRRLTQARVRISSDPANADTLPALLIRFEAPHSYTGEDLAELQVPGNPALLDRLLHRVMALGARLAEPGEFTFRAYLAGKLDLTQAEGVAATIAATSDTQLQAAGLLREGKLGSFTQELVDELATQLALVEAGIDFTDQEDVVPIAPDRLAGNLLAIQGRLDELLRNSRSWGVLEALPRVVLVGAPSTGKSTLFNVLLGRERAVVSEFPGTTRDILAEPLMLTTATGSRFEIMLIDVAGLDNPATALDRQAQEAARDAIRHADLILHIDDGQAGGATVLFHPALTIDSKAPVIRVRSKSDLHDDLVQTTDMITVSARTGRGIPALKTAITDCLSTHAVGLSARMLALQPRHESALRTASARLRQVIHLLGSQRDNMCDAGGGKMKPILQVELVAAGLRAALDELACLGGGMTPDDVIGRVFATFCVGK